MKFIDDILESIKKDGIIKTSISISVVITITIIASICYLIEHTYNFITGKDWTGLSLWNTKEK